MALLKKSSQSYGASLAIWITQCYLPPDTSERAPRITPAREAVIRFTYPGGIEG